MPTDHYNYLTAKQKHQKQLCQSKTNSWKSFYSEEGNRDPWGRVFSFLKQNYDDNIQKVILSDKNGNVCFSNYEAAEIILDHFFPPDNSDFDDSCHKLIRLCIKQPYPMDDNHPFTITEIRNIINNLNNSRAPGHDSITAEVIKHL